VSIFLDACRCIPTDRVPVWFMRQAGRSLPEYRKARGSGSILEAVRNPELVVELTVQPVRRHGVDAAILFSDIMVPVAAVVSGIEVTPGRGPVLSEPFRSRSDLARLRPLEPAEDVSFVIDAVRELGRVLRVPLIGFAGGPFTVASYLIEGGPSRDWARTKAMMRSDEGAWDELMGALAENSLAFLRAQVEAGAQAVQLFDSWAGALSRRDYLRYAAPHSARVLAGLADLGVPRIHFGVGTGELLFAMAEAGAEVVGVDWRVSLAEARRRIGPGRAVQGNLDPTACLLDAPLVREEVHAVLDEAGAGPGHVFNLGHGVLPETDPGILTAIVEWVHEWDPAPKTPGDSR
jgi:uroporphyrinogen decarboxylase